MKEAPHSFDISFRPSTKDSSSLSLCILALELYIEAWKCTPNVMKQP